MKITVIGCGHGAFAAAADLSARGHEITLYADKAHSEYFDAIRSSTEVFLPLEGLNDLSGRYLTEDAPFSLVAMSEIGRQAGVKTEAMDAIITLASLLRSDSYRETGLTLKRLGIDGLDKAGLRQYLDTGIRN